MIYYNEHHGGCCIFFFQILLAHDREIFWLRKIIGTLSHTSPLGWFVINPQYHQSGDLGWSPGCIGVN